MLRRYREAAGGDAGAYAATRTSSSRTSTTARSPSSGRALPVRRRPPRGRDAPRTLHGRAAALDPGGGVMDGGHRRASLLGCTAAGTSALVADRLAAAAPVQNRRPAAGSAAPALAIAHYRTPSRRNRDGVAEEARRLTRQAVDALGGMRRFVSRGDVVWVKPNIGWDRRPSRRRTRIRTWSRPLSSSAYQAGAKSVIVTDNASNAAQRTFPRSGIQAAEKAGAESSSSTAQVPADGDQGQGPEGVGGLQPMSSRPIS